MAARRCSTLSHSNEDDWPHRVERMLKADGLANVEVINAGIPGFSSAEAVGTLFAEGHLVLAGLRPSLCIEWNDIKLFNRPNSLLREFARDEFPRIHGRLIKTAWTGLLSNVSQLYVRLRERYYTWKLNLGDGGHEAGRRVLVDAYRSGAEAGTG